MALRINLEIGHEASLRTKRTPEGFTHDWKIFVRGSEGADIHYYVEKVVFYLHETFPKPKRVVKEPPYTVKESGYAGFNLPIDIYLRNSGEPKKIKFNYDLNLQPSGPPLSKVQKEKYIFIAPLEDFRQKLLRGGGVVTSSSQESNETKSVLYEEKNQLISKPRFGGSDPISKKIKIEPQVQDRFQHVFGAPITKTTKPQETKVQPPKENRNNAKLEKSVDKTKSKHSPHKEKDKDKERDKSEKKTKDEKKKEKDRKDRERERSREKNFTKDKSPRPPSPSPKHVSPKPSSPLPRPSAQLASTNKHREKEIKADKEKKEKPEKEDRKMKKEKKERDHSRDKHRDSSKIEHKNKETKLKETVSISKESDISQSTSSTPTPSSAQTKQDKKDKPKDEEKLRIDKDKLEDKKHKHKRKDKSRKEKKDLEEKKIKTGKKSEKDKSVTPVSNTGQPLNGNESLLEKNDLFGSSPKTESNSMDSSPKEKEKTSKPLTKLFSTFSEASSDSSPSSREPSPVSDVKKREKVKKTSKRNIEKDSDKKKKRKASSDVEQPPEKVVKEENLNNNSDSETINSNNKPSPENQSTSDAEDYMSILRSLQHKIMTLKDNADLQKVVQLIAETGQYEISAHTFDFDLCLLDRSTVKQLQDFLSTTS